MTPRLPGSALAISLVFAAPVAGHAQALQLCVQEGGGFVVALQQDQTCEQLPGIWVALDIGDHDWTGEGTGAMRTASPNDRVAVGDTVPDARLHVAYTGDEGAAMLVEDPDSATEAMRVTPDWRTILGGISGDSARLTVNAPAGDEAIRARAGGVTSFVVAADGQVGVGTSVPAAALAVAAQGDEDPLHVTPPGTSRPALVLDADGELGIGVETPEDKLAVLNEGLGRAGFFRTENAGNIAAALSATTTGRGNAVFANVLNRESTSAALRAVHSGGGRAGQFDGSVSVSGNLGINTLNPTAKLVVEGDDDGADVVVRDERFARMRMVAEAPTDDVTLSVQARGSSNAERAEIGTVSNHGMVLFTNGETRIRLQRNGAVCIGNC